MTEREVIKIFENEVIILDCWIEHCKDIIADCETEEDEFDDDKERAELSLRDYTERKESFDVAIEALKEVQQYREIGTVEECREAVEKQKPKKILPLTNGLLFDDGWRHKCPNCGCAVWENIYHPDVTKDYEYCSMCGQAIHE